MLREGCQDDNGQKIRRKTTLAASRPQVKPNLIAVGRRSSFGCFDGAAPEASLTTEAQWRWGALDHPTSLQAGRVSILRLGGMCVILRVLSQVGSAISKGTGVEIWPAIDLRGGKCVRLRQGDYAQETVFGDDPAAIARAWIEQGGKRLHLVDLDAAKDGSSANLASVRAIVGAVDAPCELGGGVRSEEKIAELVAIGLARLVVGTRALKDPGWFRQMCRKYPGRLVLGIDARDGMVATDGWLETSRTPAVELARQSAGEPLAAIVYTDIATDGMMAGPNVDAMAEMQSAVDVPVVASGGVTTLEDVRRLAGAGLAGCIIGRALYEGTIDLAAAIEAANDS